jgi:hypothetical protein
MKKMYFFNLSLDQLYDEKAILNKLFPLRVPRSEALVRLNEDYAYLITKQEDTAFQFTRPEPWVEKIWRSHMPDLGAAEVIRANPYDWSKWLEEFNDKRIHHQFQFNTALVCGISPLEEVLNREIPISNIHPIDLRLSTYLNKKTNLPIIASDLKLGFPESNIKSSEQLLSDLKSPVEYKEYIIKAPFGSGGGSNFAILDNPHFFKYFLNFLNGIPSDFEWLVQKKINRNLDFSYVGDVKISDTGEFFEILYDQFSLSYMHKSLEDKDVLTQLIPVADRVKKYLKDKGYRGPFGFDGFMSSEGEIYPMIDLNVRWTKSHFFSAIKKRLKIKDSWAVIRERFVCETKYDVESLIEFFAKIAKENKIQLFLPLNLTGLFQGSPGKSEFTYFVQSSPLNIEKFRIKIKESLLKL